MLVQSKNNIFEDSEAIKKYVKRDLKAAKGLVSSQMDI